MSEEVKEKKQCAGDPGAGQTEKKPDIHSGEGREESLKKEHTADTAKDAGEKKAPEPERAGGSAKAAQAETPDAGDAAGGKQTETAEGSGSDKDSSESKPDKKLRIWSIFQPGQHQHIVVRRLQVGKNRPDPLRRRAGQRPLLQGLGSRD